MGVLSVSTVYDEKPLKRLVKKESFGSTALKCGANENSKNHTDFPNCRLVVPL